MKRPKLTRRQLDARMPGPVLRDVHPDCETMALYGHDGALLIESDMPAGMMKAARKVAKASGVSPAEFLVRTITKAIKKRQRGF